MLVFSLCVVFSAFVLQYRAHRHLISNQTETNQQQTLQLHWLAATAVRSEDLEWVTVPGVNG